MALRDIPRAPLLALGVFDGHLFGAGNDHVNVDEALERTRRGEVVVRVLRERGREGIEVVASDDGPGIADVELALQDGYTTGNGLGLGLPGARRLVDDFELDTQPGAGTRVRLVKWRA